MKITKIIFWLIVAVALLLLSGSPPEIDALIVIALFVSASELLLWRKLFSTDKNIAVSFEKMGSGIKIKHNKILGLIE